MELRSEAGEGWQTGDTGPEIGPDGAVTHDSLLRGQVKLIQPARGFRSSLDPVLLASFLEPPYGRFLDIGCGTGALSFLLLHRDPEAAGVGLEVQRRLGALAIRGTTANQHQARFAVRVGDARRHTLPAASFDLVVVNPPFQRVGQGELPPDEERSIAHHEIQLTLRDWLDLAATLVRPEARVGVVFPAPRAAELLAGLCARGLQPVRLRPVYPRRAAAATRVLVESRRLSGPRPLEMEPGLVVHEGSGYSSEVRRMLGEES
jgi:tRNA1Val (adenine37-N6)-methyltransferase